MKILELYFNSFHLGNLTHENEHYVFELNEDSTKLLLKTGVNIAVFEAASKKTVSKTLPLVFENFLPKDDEKMQMLEQLGILKNDSSFEKLVKISKLSLNRKSFWLRAIEN
ncbi:MAG: hypothetical protein CVV59_02210 [Tenericutes bacterium HGW-Tenericutes-4]|jgi:hypothetical protein|nr:MAG: hypothetical protein CVV59_02210 [Tenericutes bacterium HGW-Tenericutes-4]